jgi:hypothetical protein
MKIMKNPFALWHLLALVAAISVGGCGPGDTEPADDAPVTVEGTPPPLAGASDEHEHPTEGPHGGHLYEIGNEQYHAEMLHDEGTHKVTVHLLDSTGKQAVSTTETELALLLFRDPQYVTYTLQAVGAGDAGASQFELVSEELCELLDHDKKIQGRMQVTIGDESFTVMIEHNPHEHAGHGHDEGAGHDQDEAGHHDDGDGDGHGEDGDEHKHP